jgi:hypothetical protein
VLQELFLIKENEEFRYVFLKWIFYLFFSVSIYFTLWHFFWRYDFLYFYFKPYSTSVCDSFPSKISAIVAPFIETVLCMYLPFRFFHKKGLIVGITIWSLLHIFSGIIFLVYIFITGFFYYQLMKYNRWKETILFHGLVNWTGVTTCFFI